MTVVQLETIADSSNSNSEESFAASSAAVASIIMTIIIGIALVSGGVSLLFGSAAAAKTSTSMKSFTKNTLLNTAVIMSVIMSLLITLLHYEDALYNERDEEYPSIIATFLVIFVLLAIIYKFLFPFDMGTRSKIMVHLLLFHIIYWGGSWMFE